MSQCCGSFYERSNSSTNKACACARQAENAALLATTSLADFKSRYLGAFPSDPAQPFPPAAPFIEGAIYFNSSTNSFFVWDGFNWIGVDIFGAAGGDLTGTYPNPQIAAGAIVDADINAAAAIALSKLATGALPAAITVSSSNIVDGTIVDADINASAAIGLSKLATGALPSAITISSANIVDETIVNADVSPTAAIAGTKVNPAFGAQNITTTGTASDYRAIQITNASGVQVQLAANANTSGDLRTTTNHPFSFLTNNTERMRIEANGDVGIGAVSPSSKLEVVGDLTLGGTTTATSATAGTNGDVPAQVVGYLVVKINGTSRNIPYYAT